MKFYAKDLQLLLAPFRFLDLPPLLGSWYRKRDEKTRTKNALKEECWARRLLSALYLLAAKCGQSLFEFAYETFMPNLPELWRSRMILEESFLVDP